MGVSEEYERFIADRRVRLIKATGN